MPTTVTITDLAAELKERATEAREVTIQQMMIDRNELAPVAEFVEGVLDEQPILLPKLTSIVQRGRTAGFNPTGTLSFDDAKLKMRPMKADFSLTAPDVDKLYRSYLGLLRKNKGNPQYDPSTFPFADFVYEKLLTRRLVADSNNAMVNGDYANGAGTLNTMDGIQVQVKDAITNGVLAGDQVIAGAAITVANAGDQFGKFETAYVAKPAAFGRKMYLLCSPAVHKLYRDWSRTTYGAQQGSNKEEFLFVNQNTNLQIVPIGAMAGSNRIIAFLEGNLLTGMDGDNTTLDTEYRKSDREIRFFSDWACGLTLGDPEQIWVNNYNGIT